MPLSFMLSFLIWVYENHMFQNGLPFEQTPQSSTVPKSIEEASGIADSKINSGYLWIHEDSGSRPHIWLLKKDGTSLKSIAINGATNIDWEDMGLGKGPDGSKNYLYLADIGDNGLSRTHYTIYRFEEPASTRTIVENHDKITFKYPDGPRNAEAILIDNVSKDIYVITKSDNPSQIYKIAYPQSTTAINQAVPVGQLTFGGVTGAAISADGKEIIIKTYPALSYFSRNSGQSIEQSLNKPWVNLSYQIEPQGEAVAFASDNSGVFTMSEKGFSGSVKLYFYKRK